MTRYIVDYQIPETDVRVSLTGDQQYGPLRSEHPEFRAVVYWSLDDGYRATLDVGEIAILSPRFMRHDQALDYCCNRLRTIRMA